MVWEAIFLLVILKIPIVYLCWVVWWAIRAKPDPPREPEAVAVPIAPETDGGPTRTCFRARRPRTLGPHGSPSRSYARRPAFARASSRSSSGPE